MALGGGSGSGGDTRRRAPGGEAPRPAHLIRPDEVAGWLSDSVNQRITYHRTARLEAQEIIEHGVRISRSRIGAYGQGFYTATDPEAFPGDATLRLAIRLRKPLIGDMESIGDRVDEIADRLAGSPLITPAVARRIRLEFIRLGYDGIIVHDAGGDGIDYVIALLVRTVRIVQP